MGGLIVCFIILIFGATSAHAADRYWVGGGSAATWAATGNTNWGSASNTQDNASVPTAADDVYFDGVGTGAANCTVAALAAARSVNFTGYANTFTLNGGVTMNIGDATAGAGNIAWKFSAGMTFSAPGGSSTINFISSSTTSQTITCNGIFFLNNIAVNHANIKLQMVDGIKTYTFTGTAFNTFDMNGQTITLTGNGQFAGNGKTYNGPITFDSSSAICTISGANTFSSLVTFSGSTELRLNAANTFSAGLTVSPTAVTTAAVRLDANQTVSGGNLTLAGNSQGNRLLIRSDTVGTTRTITNAGSTAVWSNVDLRDITLGTAYDASGITGNSGDCGGNTGITFTPAATQTWQGTTSGSWSNAAKWTSRSPLPQDDVVISSAFAGGQTITADMPRLGKSINFTGTTGNPTVAISNNTEHYGSMTLVSGLNPGWAASSKTMTWMGRGSFTFTTAGISCGAITINMPSGTCTLQDALTQGGLTVTKGTFTTNNMSVTGAGLFSSSGSIVNLGSTLWSISGSGNTTMWSVNSGTTFDGGTSTVFMSAGDTADHTFAMGGKTYYNFKWTTGGAGAITIQGSNTFNAWQHTGGTTKTIKVTAGTTQTFTGGAGALQGGASGQLITYKSVTDTSAWTLSSATKIVTDYISLRDSTGAGAGISHNGGGNSTNVSGNTNWVFQSAASGNFFTFLE